MRRERRPAVRRMLGLAVPAVLVGALAACGGTPAPPNHQPVPVSVVPRPPASTQPAAPPPTAPATVAGGPTASAAPAPIPASPSPTPVANGATPAPSWLGTRVLTGRKTGLKTPRELRDRRIVTVDLLPPPADGAFHGKVSKVPDEVAARSTWHDTCPVKLSDLRYVRVSFVGFDGRAHSGELLVHRSAARGMVQVFRRLFEARYPIESMHVTTAAELAARPTGDGNNTSAFVCRSAVGGQHWSEHAYGKAIDVNPFHNPYVKGSITLPELATSYRDRTSGKPGVITPDGPVVAAFNGIGWGWGGSFQSLKDFMHFSANGR